MNRHRADALSLLAGLAFCGLGLAFLGGPDAVRLTAALSWPAVLVALSLGLLAGALSRRRARRRAVRQARREAQDSGARSSDTEFMQ